MHSVRAGQNCSSEAKGCLAVREELGPLAGSGIVVTISEYTKNRSVRPGILEGFLLCHEF